MGLGIPFYHSLTCKKPRNKQDWTLGWKVEVAWPGVVAEMEKNGEIQISMEENGQNFTMHVETREMERLGTANYYEPDSHMNSPPEGFLFAFQAVLSSYPGTSDGKFQSSQEAKFMHTRE